MKILNSKRYVILRLTVIIIGCICVQQRSLSQTNVIATKADAYLNWHEGSGISGNNYRIYNVYIYVDDQLLGSCELNSMYNSEHPVFKQNPNIVITNPNPYCYVKYTYHYHRWNTWGTQEKVDNDIICSQQNLNLSSGQLKSLALYLVDPQQNYRHLTLDITLTPAKPTFTSALTAKQCYDSPFLIEVDHNNPSKLDDLNKNNQYEWQYGEKYDKYTLRNEFTWYVINPIIDYMYQKINGNYQYNGYAIEEFFKNASYNYFKNKNITTKNQFANGMNYWFYNYYYENYGAWTGNDAYYEALSYDDRELIRENIRDAVDNIYYNDNWNPYDVTQEINWKQVSSLTSGPKLTFNPDDYYVKSEFKTAKTIYLRVRGKRSSINGPWSENKIVTVLPPVPVIDLNQVVVDASCPGEGRTGTISLNKITSDISSQYTYRIGHRDTCTLVDINNGTNCGWTKLPQNFSGNSANIPNVPSGWAKIFLTYQDANIRNCFSEGKNVIEVYVPALPELSIATDKSNVHCEGETNGQIKISVQEGGGDYKFGLYQNELPYTQCDSLIEAAQATYSNLPKGDFTVKAVDKCKVPKSGSYTITEPTRASITNAAFVSVTDPTCTLPANGRIDSLMLSGPTKFTYLVNGQPYNRQIWREGLSAGTYTIDVLDADHPSCPGDQIVKTLNPPASLQIGTVAITDLRCFGIPDGEIEVGPGSGGSQALQYQLYRLSDNTRFTHPSNIFTNLQSGDYRLTLRNTGNWCADTVYRTLTVQTPPELVASLIADSVRCYGENNGKIIHTVSGGTGAHTLVWQQKKAVDFWMPQTLNLNSLSPGDYRLVVTDANNCSVTSNAVEIGEPLPLIGVSRLNDIRCFGEKGSIAVNASGGNGKYLFEYDKGSGYTLFPADSLLDVGLYSVRVTDRKGCTRSIGSGLSITAPTAPLAFTYTASDYNGFNISCFGNNDGRLDILATGGNSTSYSGYIYNMNALVQANNPLFDQLTAGPYVLKVRDARGCEVTQNLSMTQPSAGLTFAAPLIKDVTCYDHTDGTITLSPLGGTAPFTYRIGSGDFTSSALFEGLGVGAYDFTVRDVNGCLWNQQFPVTNLVPKMEIDGVVSNVNCFGGNDGSVSISLTGGRSPINYLWKETGATTRDASMLTVGSYTLLATDDAGCLMEKGFTVGQPLAPLALSASSKPVCVGVSHGYVRPRATAGTPPYVYAIDQPQGFITQDEFTASPGVHSVFASDANGCQTETSIEVEVKNKMPSVNFMAATMRYAMDTLVLKEVNVPKPDSVEWTLAQGMYMIGGDEFSPVVTTDHPGQYTVLMTGWFEGCDYTIEKLLQFSEFDPSVIPDATKENGISTIELYPNPNTGEFRVKVGLFVKQQVMIKVVDITSGVWFTKQYAPAEMVEEYINITKAPPGVYVLMVIAEHDAKSVRVVKQ